MFTYTWKNGHSFFGILTNLCFIKKTGIILLFAHSKDKKTNRSSNSFSFSSLKKKKKNISFKSWMKTRPFFLKTKWTFWFLAQVYKQVLKYTNWFFKRFLCGKRCRNYLAKNQKKIFNDIDKNFTPVHKWKGKYVWQKNIWNNFRNKNLSYCLCIGKIFSQKVLILERKKEPPGRNLL